MEILSFCAPPLSPGTVSNALGASATSFAPMPRKPPTLTTKASILPDLSNRMSLIEPTFWLSEPSHLGALELGGHPLVGLLRRNEIGFAA